MGMSLKAKALGTVIATANRFTGLHAPARGG